MTAEISVIKQPFKTEDSLIRRFIEYKLDWNRYAKEILNIRLDREQRKILRGIQENKKIAISSGHARGKDYLSAVACLCFLYLNYPSKVICTAPTGRQVFSIMMSEISKIHSNANINLGGNVLQNRISFGNKNRDWFLEGFKAGDKKREDWSGFHSPNVMITVTEASGLPDETFDAIEGLLTGGNSKLLICFNPTRLDGVTYRCVFDRSYKYYSLSCLNAPNVRAKKVLIPGQVDYEYVNERTGLAGWSREIERKEYRKDDKFNFKFNNKYYVASDMYATKILGVYPKESENQLIPVHWLEMAKKRWEQIIKSRKKIKEYKDKHLKMGVDVAGMGTNNTVFCDRYDMFVENFRAYGKMEHMETVGKIKNSLKSLEDIAYIDTIGEGAGVYSRTKELDIRAVNADFRKSAEGFNDYTKARTFLNMRGYCFWAVRDNLDPEFNGSLALPYIPELWEDIMYIKYKTRSDGKIYMISKDEIKTVLGRSIDWFDSLALSFYPYSGRRGGASFKK